FPCIKLYFIFSSFFSRYLSWNRLWLLKNQTFSNLLKLRRLNFRPPRLGILGTPLLDNLFALY
ncbi:hypothetical protein L9F63_024625, partial [Diploptera punctata]